MSKEILLARLKEIGIISNDPVTLRSGEASAFYCDIKKACGYPDVLDLLADVIGEKIGEDTTCVAGTGYGGLPLAALVASRFQKKFIAVREKPKSHGKGGLIDGYIPAAGDKVVIIDDVLTTGSSIKTTIAGLSSVGAVVVGAIVVVERKKAVLPIPYQYVFSINDLI